MLSPLSQTANASIGKTFQALLGRKDARPGSVSSLQTHRAYGANSNRGRIRAAARDHEDAGLPAAFRNRAIRMVSAKPAAHGSV